MKLLNVSRHVLSIFPLLILMSGCVQSAPTKVKYNQNSWKTIIPDSCRSYFDGCNNCRRSPASDIAACTRKMCIEYEKPICLDKTN